MSSLSGALDESALKPKPDPGLNDIEMHTESHQPTTESEDSGEEEQDEEMADLFGNDDEEEPKPDRSAVASPTASGPESDRLPTPEREHRQALEYEEDEIPPDTGEVVKEADVSFPNLPIPKSSDGNNWVIRMPSFVKMDTKPFHPDTYLGPEEEESMQAESLREKSMSIKLKVENTVRWRWIKNASGVDQRQSNSRIIRWSDGAMSLLLGKELFDIAESIDTSAGIPRQVAGSKSQSQSQLSQSQSQTSGLKSQGLTYLVAQHKRSQVLQSEAVVTGYMTLRPTGMQSETHRMLVRAVGQKHSKVARLRMAPDPTMDPERGLKELAKQNAKKSRRKNDFDDLGGVRRRRQSRRAADTGALWSSDEDAGGEYENYDDEDEDGGLGFSARKGKRKAVGEKKNLGEDYQEDDFVVADSSDEEGVSRKKRVRSASDGEDDPLDRLDAKIEEQDTKKRKMPEKSGDAEGETDEDGMDIESEEEDEDDFKVRRVGGGRKRTHISMGEDEEE